MTIVTQFASYSRPTFPLLSPPPKRLALPAPNYLKTSKVMRLEIAQTPENQARRADSFDDLLRSIGPLLTMDDAYAVIERHNRIYHERRAKREAEHARYMAALNDWWNQYLAARPGMLQAAEVQS